MKGRRYRPNSRIRKDFDLKRDSGVFLIVKNLKQELDFAEDINPPSRKKFM